MAKRQISFGALLGISAGVLFGQSAGPPLTLQDAEAMALKNHPQILASQDVYLRSDQIIRQNRAAYYPSLNGEITGAQANADSRLGAGVLNDPRLFTHFGSGLTLSQLITDSGRTPNLVANSKLNAAADRENYRATRYDVLLEVNQAYYEVLLAQQLVKVAQQTVSTRQSVVDQVSELTKNKLRSDVDLSFAQVNLAGANLMILRAKDRLSSAYASLGRALGTQQAIEYQLADQPQPPAPPTEAETLIHQAFENRPELASLRLQSQADQKFAYAERDLKRPTVSLSAVGGALPWIKPGNANADIPTEYEAVGVNVQVPIFNGHLFSARERAADYQVAATNQRERDVEDRVAQDVRSSWAHTAAAYAAIAPTEQLIKQADMALDLAHGRYDLGLASIVELTQAQLGQTQAQVENLNAKYTYQEAYAALQYTLGLLR